MPFAQRPEPQRPELLSSRREEGLVSLGVVVLAIWAVATVLVLAVAAETTVGPVLLSLSTNHGVHLGDLVAAAVAYAAAAILTARVVPQRRGR